MFNSDWHDLIGLNNGFSTELTLACLQCTNLHRSPTLVKKEVKKFEASTENLLRSIKVLYSGGLLSKEKYKAIRINLTMSTS